MDGRVCILYIEKLPEDKKYVMYNGNVHEKKLTDDHRVPKAEVDKQKELRVELELASELKKVDNTSLDNLNVDKLNNYIQRLNQGMTVETLKADIPTAISFLEKKNLLLRWNLLYWACLFVEAICTILCRAGSRIVSA